jgi:hypothetical protein
MPGGSLLDGDRVFSKTKYLSRLRRSDVKFSTRFMTTIRGQFEPFIGAEIGHAAQGSLSIRPYGHEPARETFDGRS